MKTRKIFWSCLQPGDTVDVIAPGSKVSADELRGADTFLQSWGLVPRIPKDLFGPDVICSNRDERRWHHLKTALLSRDSKAIWCLRGGYGANRLLPRLASLARPRQAKLIIGFSDVTSLHIFVNQCWEWPSLHGPMLGSLGARSHPPSVIRDMRGLLFGTQPTIAFKGLKPMNEPARRARTVRGSIVGGNLITVQSTLGTPWQLSCDKKILFIEEINERGYRVDRVLAHLEHSGALKGVKAVVFGDFVGGQEPDGRTAWRAVLQRFADEMPFPVLKGIRSGHGVMQRPVPFQTPSVLKTGQVAQLVCESGGQGQ